MKATETNSNIYTRYEILIKSCQETDAEMEEGMLVVVGRLQDDIKFLHSMLMKNFDLNLEKFLFMDSELRWSIS